MDPLTALGVAGNIIQFVEFARSLVSTAYKIHGSETGSSPNNLRLEQVCEALGRLSDRLGSAAPSPGPTLSPLLQSAPEEDSTALRELSQGCKKDCEKLLAILEKLKVKNGSNLLWNSVKAALKTKMEQKAVAELERQLARAEKLMSLHAIKTIK